MAANKQQYRVLVTGFGANKHHTNKVSNPSGEIAAIMPSFLSAGNPLNVSGKDIQLLNGGVKPEWVIIPATWTEIRTAMRDIFEKFGDQIDLWIHLGRGGEPTCYTCERRAYSQDFTSSWASPTGYYHNLDNNDQKAHDIGQNPWTAKGVPLGLDPALNISRVVELASERFTKDFMAKHDEEAMTVPRIRSHVEAGSAACGFGFYEMLANYWAAGKPGHALFCHVPSPVDNDALETGRDAILAIIGACIASIIEEDGKPPRADGISHRRWRYFMEH